MKATTVTANDTALTITLADSAIVDRWGNPLSEYKFRLYTIPQGTMISQVTLGYADDNEDDTVKADDEG